MVEYPAWLKRIEFGSKVLPIEPCTIGDAQPELIKILLLQIGLHILRIYRIFQRTACLCETPASLSICVVCKGFLVSHGWRKRIKVTVATVPTAEPRPQEEDVKDHVKKAWEEVKIDLTGEEDDDEQMQDDDDVTMKSPEQEPQPEDENDDQASKKDDIDNERRDFREQDEVDEFLNEEREQAEENDDEETEGGESTSRNTRP